MEFHEYSLLPCLAVFPCPPFLLSSPYFCASLLSHVSREDEPDHDYPLPSALYETQTVSHEDFQTDWFAFTVPIAPFVHFQGVTVLAQTQTDSSGLTIGRPRKADIQDVGRKMHFNLGEIFVPQHDLIALSTWNPWLHIFATLKLFHVGLEGTYAPTSLI